jgi:hypothetical protein
VVSDTQLSARLHNILSRDDDYKMGAFRFPSGVFTSNDQEVAELRRLRPIFQDVNQSQSQNHNLSRRLYQEDWLIASSVITKQKNGWAINGFGSYETAGEDRIFSGLLQQRIVGCATLLNTHGLIGFGKK